MVKLKKLIAVAALALALTTNASSASVCGSHELVVKIFKDRFKEEPQGMGITSNDRGMVELFVGPAPKKEWSIVVTDTNKLSCVLYTGKNWQSGDGLMKGTNHASF